MAKDFCEYLVRPHLCGLFFAVFLKEMQTIMKYIDTISIYQQMVLTIHDSLLEKVISLAVRYARIRTDYYLSDDQTRLTMEDERTAAHNAFINACDNLSKSMIESGEKAEWRQWLGNDPKDIGLFASNLHALLGNLVK